MSAWLYTVGLIPKVTAYEGELDPIVEKVLIHISNYSDLPKRIHIGDTLWHYVDDRMWKPSFDDKPFVTDDDVYYDVNGDLIKVQP